MTDPGGSSNPSGSTMGWASSPHAANFTPGNSAPLVEILYANRSPCPVCAHPTGDCVGHDPGIESSVTFTRKVVDPNATFTVPERVYETILQGKRRTRRLVYAPGDRITPTEARRLGLMPPIPKLPGRHD